MATAIAGFFQRSNIDLGTWNWGDVALGFRAGLLPTQLCLNALRFTPSFEISVPLGNATVKGLESPLLQILPCCLAILTTWGRINGLARTEPLIARHMISLQRGFIACLGISWLVLHFTPPKQNPTPSEKRITSLSWKALPFCLLVTNIALSIFELSSHRMKAAVALTLTSLVLLDEYKVLPWTITRYLNPGLRLPMDLVAMSYVSNSDRFAIAAGWLAITRIQITIDRLIGRRLLRILPFLHLPGALFWRV